MTSQTVADEIKMVRIGAGPGLFARERLDLVEQLDTLARESCSSSVGYSAVALILDSGVEEVTESFAEELANVLFLDELAQRVVRVRQITAAIRASKVPWIFLAEDRCSGSVFELCLSCHRKVWFRQSAKVGFAEITEGCFPAAGGFESLLKTRAGAKRAWESKAVVSASEAAELGWIDYAVNAADWKKDADSLIAQQASECSEVIGSSLVPDANFLRGELPPKTVIGEFAAPKGLAKFPSAWKWSQEVLKLRKSDSREEDLTWPLALIASRHLLSESFLDRNEFPFEAKPSSLNSALIIDLEKRIPPIVPLAALLEEGNSVVCWARDSFALAQSLEVLYGRLERFFRSRKGIQIWHQQVNWFVGGDSSQLGLPLAQWDLDDSLTIKWSGQSLRSYVVQSDEPKAGPGFAEVTGQTESGRDDRLNEILSELSAAIVYSSGVGPEQIPVTVFLRSVFFEKMWHARNLSNKGLVGIADALRGAGWGFASDEGGWSQFLKIRQDCYGSALAKLELSFTSFDAEALGIPLWKVAARGLPGDSVDRDAQASAAYFVHHFTAVAGLLALMITHNGWVSASDAELVVMRSLGFPADQISPRSYLKRMGDKRLKSFLSRFWPELSLDGLGELSS